MRKLFLLSVILWAFFLNSCLEADVDIDLRRDGSGEMRMKILPLESSLNPIISELEADLRKDKNYKDSDMTKKVEPDGRVSIFTRKKFKRVEEADENCRFTSQKDYDEFTMNIPGDLLGIVKKVSIKMPGKIIESNVKNFEGRTLTWDRSLSSGNRLVIKSKPPEPVGYTTIIALIVILGIGIVIALVVLKMKQKPEVVTQEFNFCSECGNKINLNDNFCHNCGQRLR
jgi:hypothetical protein